VDPKLLWLILLIIFTLVQIILLLVKNKKEKANNPGNYGERIGRLEKGQEIIEARLKRIDGILNGTYRK